MASYHLHGYRGFPAVAACAAVTLPRCPVVPLSYTCQWHGIGKCQRRITWDPNLVQRPVRDICGAAVYPGSLASGGEHFRWL